jgi:hypothetical protein
MKKILLSLAIVLSLVTNAEAETCPSYDGNTVCYSSDAQTNDQGSTVNLGTTKKQQ